FSTYLGGTGATSVNAIDVDASGNVYVVGSVASADFPIKDSLQPYRGGGGGDVYLAKFTAAGNALVYSTFIGGSKNEGPQPALALGLDGSAYVAGWTLSSDFPVRKPFQGSLGGGADAFLVKISDASNTSPPP